MSSELERARYSEQPIATPKTMFLFTVRTVEDSSITNRTFQDICEAVTEYQANTWEVTCLDMNKEVTLYVSSIDDTMTTFIDIAMHPVKNNGIKLDRIWSTQE